MEVELRPVAEENTLEVCPERGIGIESNPALNASYYQQFTAPGGRDSGEDCDGLMMIITLHEYGSESPRTNHE
jgi:hypothetical protein